MAQAIKSNDEIGYRTLDMTCDNEEYSKSKKKFEAAIESTFYNTAVQVSGACEST